MEGLAARQLVNVTRVMQRLFSQTPDTAPGECARWCREALDASPWRLDESTVDLNTLRLTQLVPEIAKLQGMRALNVSHNRLRFLPEWLLDKKNELKELHVASNQISEIPDWIGELKELEKLSISNNPLPALPPALGRLRHLRYLAIANLNLHSIPEELGRCNHLLDLWLHRNHLTVEDLPARWQERFYDKSLTCWGFWDQGNLTCLAASRPSVQDVAQALAAAPGLWQP